jgi:hypothetical protein
MRTRTKDKHHHTIYFPRDLKAGVQEEADAEGRSFTMQVEWIVRDWWIKRQRDKQEDLEELSFY